MLLRQLEGAHNQLLHEMDNLDHITLDPHPASNELGTARWRISQASFKRRTLASKILDFLSDKANQAEAVKLEKLRSENQAAMLRSARHVYRWTQQAIGEDWKSYSKASRDIRLQMRANLLLEKQTLYPILERLAARER